MESIVGIFGDAEECEWRICKCVASINDDVASRRLKYWMFIGMQWDLIWTILAAEDFYFKPIVEDCRCNEIITSLVRKFVYLFC